jgi:long-chain acyl-CoA synthetase
VPRHAGATQAHDGSTGFRRGPLQYPRRRVDEYLGDWAGARPDAIALRDGSGPMSFGELDGAVTAAADALRVILGGATGTVVAVASILDATFVVAYQSVLRSGNIVAPVNPLLREAALAHQLSTARARVALVTAEMNDRIERLRADVDELLELVIVDGGPGAVLARLRELGERSTPASADSPCLPVRHRRGAAPGRVAAIHFTSGTTGAPKAVLLTHRNVTANALQVADAHQLTASATMLIDFPTYHPMHMNGGLVAGATQVLSGGADVLDAVKLAQCHRATHYYSVPARLTRLSMDERLGTVDLPATRFLASGGAALPTTVAGRLRARFGVPVIQGYGLAETAPLTHFDVPERPKPGSVGPAVADTECRVVEVGARNPLGPGDRGEVQVRGPQLMKGYLGRTDATGIDADGWFSTGDIGYLDEEGYLFLVDRIKDVFKCDSWLVSPTEIEAALAAHPAVRDCAVVDRPDPLSGAVPHAFVALHDAAGPASVEDIVGSVNAELPDFQRIRHVDILPEIPRSPNGKIQRTVLRADVHSQVKLEVP